MIVVGAQHAARLHSLDYSNIFTRTKARKYFRRILPAHMACEDLAAYRPVVGGQGEIAALAAKSRCRPGSENRRAARSKRRCVRYASVIGASAVWEAAGASDLIGAGASGWGSIVRSSRVIGSCIGTCI